VLHSSIAVHVLNPNTAAPLGMLPRAACPRGLRNAAREGYASLVTKANEPVRALHLLGGAIRLREEIGGKAGRAISLHEAVAYALEEEDGDRSASDQVDQSNRPISRPPADT
jgi:hypothetical protein